MMGRLACPNFEHWVCFVSFAYRTPKQCAIKLHAHLCIVSARLLLMASAVLSALTVSMTYLDSVFLKLACKAIER